MDNSINKIYPTKIDIKKGINKREKITFVTSDINTSYIMVALFDGDKPFIVTGSTVLCSVARPDGTLLSLSCSVVGENTLEIPLGVNGTSQEGIYAFDIKTYRGEVKVVSTPVMAYTVEQSIEIGSAEEDDRLPILTSLITEVSELKELVGSTLVEAREVIAQANVKIQEMESLKNSVSDLVVESNATLEEVQQIVDSGTQDLEVKVARDGEANLKARLDRDKNDLEKRKVDKEVGKGLSTNDFTSIEKEKLSGVQVNANHYVHPQTHEADIIVETPTRRFVTDGEKAFWDSKVDSSEIKISDNTPHSTINGVKEFTCDSGYVDNIHIEGETLVNLGKKVKGTFGLFALLHTTPMSVVEGKIYTIIIDNVNSLKVDINLKYVGTNDVVAYANRGQRTQILYTADRTNNLLLTNLQEGDIDCNYLVLEGDHTSRNLTYFEGLKSVGQGDSVEVLSRCEGGNIFDGEIEIGLLNDVTGEPNNHPNCVRTKNFTKVNPGSTIYFNNNLNYARNVYYYDISKRFIGWGGGGNAHIIPNNCHYIRFRSNIDSVQNDITVMYWLSYNPMPTYQPPKYDKKQISHTLRSLPNGVKDEAINQGDKYFKIQRCGEYVITKLLLKHQQQHTDPNYWTMFIAPPVDIKRKEGNETDFLLCDKFTQKPHGQYKLGVEGIHLQTNGEFMFVDVLKNRLASNDLSGCASFLDKNPLTVAYELETPIITEIPNPNPRTFGDKTTLLINSGAIQGDADFEVTNSLGSSLNVMASKVSALDDFVNEEEVYYPTLLNGWEKAMASDTISIYRVGNMCSLQMNIKNPSNVSSGSIIIKLPSNLMPKTYTRVVGGYSTNSLNVSYNIDVTTNGEIYLYKNYNSNEQIRLNCSWYV